MTLEVQTVEGLPSGSLRTDWELLLDEDPAATIFHTPRYLGLWARTLGERTTVRSRFVVRDGRTIGIIPEGHERVGSPTGPVEVLRFVGGAAVTDYTGPLSRAEDRDDVAAAYMHLLGGMRDWDEFVAGGLPADTGWVAAFVRHAQRLGLPVLEVQDEDVCPRVDITGGYDAYLSRLPSKRRHELRRKARKLEREAGELTVRELSDAELAAGVETFLNLASATETTKAGFFQEERMRDFFRQLSVEFSSDHIFRLHVLEVGGHPAAATVSLVWEDTWALYNSAYDSGLSALAPGMVLVGELIRLAAREQRAVFDLLRGNEPYKYRFGPTERRLERVTIGRR